MSNTGTELPLLKVGDKYQIQTLNDVMLLKNASERTYQLSRFNDRQLDDLSVRAKNELREYTRNALQTRDGRKPSESDIQEEILAMGTHYDRGDPNDPLMNENISLMLIGFTKNVERLRRGRSKSVGEVRDAAGKAVSGIKKEVHGERAHSVSTQAPAPVETSVPKSVITPSAPVTMPKPVAETAPVVAPSAPVVVPTPVEKPAPVAAPAPAPATVIQKPAEKAVPIAPSWKKAPATMPPLKVPSVLVTPSAVPKAPAPKVEVDTKRPETKSGEVPTAPKAPEKVTVPDDLFGGAPAVPPAPAKKPDSVPEKAQAVPVPESKPVPSAEPAKPVKPAEPAKPAAPLPAAEPAKVPAEKVAEPASGEKMRRKFFNALPASIKPLREEIIKTLTNLGEDASGVSVNGNVRTLDISTPELKMRNLPAAGLSSDDFNKFQSYRESAALVVVPYERSGDKTPREILLFVSGWNRVEYTKLQGVKIRPE